jgi:hypothetical protein
MIMKERGFLKAKYLFLYILIFLSPLTGLSKEVNTNRVSSPARSIHLRFQSTKQKGEYEFNTGIVRGKLRQEGKSRGLSAVTYLPQKVQIDRSLGLFSFYRIFSEKTRYGSALWDRDSFSELLPNGAVKIVWPAEKEYPFEITAVYCWMDASTLDLETIVKPAKDLPKFEIFLASYFHEDFPASYIYAQKETKHNTPNLDFVEAKEAGGTWQMYPRDKHVLSTITDGRWQLRPNPVNWNISPFLAAPVGMRCHENTGLKIVLMASSEDCFAIATPCKNETHYSLYLSLLGRDIKKGQAIRVRSRLLFGQELSDSEVLKRYRKFLRELKNIRAYNKTNEKSKQGYF